MTERKKPKGDYEVGYGKPPKSGQFERGQSGNAKGRTLRLKTGTLEVSKYLPTEKLIRSVGEREHTLRVNGRATRMTEREAVMRALFHKAINGGYMAQRTYLMFQLEEDRRLAAEQERRFNSWQEYQDKVKPLFDEARKNGEPEPDLLPHPDDIEFDYGERSVKILGPLDREDAVRYDKWLKDAEIFFELMIFLDERSHGLPTDDRPIWGFATFLFATHLGLLPRRMRKIRKSLHEEIALRATGPRRRCIAHLNAELKTMGHDYDVRKMSTRLIDLRVANLRYVDGAFVEYRWPKGR